MKKLLLLVMPVVVVGCGEKTLEQRAEAGDAEEQYNLGFMLISRKVGSEKDFKEAAKWFRKSAEQGDANAQKELGVMYDFGIGIDKDLKEAAKWYRKAADQGHAIAQTRLGSLLISYGSIL